MPKALWVGFTLIAMPWLTDNQCEDTSLRTVSQAVERILLPQSAAQSTTVDGILHDMDYCRQFKRPNLSNPRVSRRPDGRRWSSKKK